MLGQRRAADDPVPLPAKNAIVGGTDTFRVQVYDPDGVATASVGWGVDGASPTAAVALNANYNCNMGTQTQCRVFEFAVDTVALALSNGSHFVTVRAQDSAAAPSASLRSWPFRVNNTGSKAGGSGTLLRRTHASQMCLDCHNLGTHSSQATSFKYGSWTQECLACHTPHATANIYLIRPSIDTPNSGTRAVDFRNTTGVAAYSFGTPQASGNGVNMCETCHTRTKNADGTPRARNNAPTDWSKHFNGDCRDCHKHAAGFAGGGESGGDDDCLGCHKFGMAVADAGRTSTYHHVVEVGNNRVAGITSYPTSATPTASTGDLDKSCTQCHADHNVFRPDINTSNTLGRGANLRTRIANGPPTGNPPAPSAPGDTSPGYYSNRDHDPAFAAGGICLSCHVSAQTKNVVDQKTYANDPGQTAAVVSAIANFGNSSHGYTSVGGQITSGNAAFQVPCSKCHSDGGTSYQNGSSRFQLHTSANRRLLNPLGISAPADPLEENFCFRCHSKSSDTTPGGGAAKGNANRDYYNQVAMSDQSERLFSVFTNTGSYPWDHPVQGTGGLHDPVEGSSADDGTIGGAQRHVQCEDCHNPHAAAPIASGAYAGAVSAYTTAAAPTPDTLSDTGTGKAWTVNGLKGFTVKMVTGAQAGKYSPIYANTANTLSVDFAAAPAVNDKYVIVNWGVTSTNAAWAGNTASPAMRDTWGLNPAWPAALTPPNWDDSAGTATAAEIGAQYATITTWARTPNATLQGQICVKCHSAYAYGASPPNTPSGAGNSLAATWVNTAGAATAQSDIASQFNPNNLSHHAVFARGGTSRSGRGRPRTTTRTGRSSWATAARSA